MLFGDRLNRNEVQYIVQEYVASQDRWSLKAVVFQGYALMYLLCSVEVGLGPMPWALNYEKQTHDEFQDFYDVDR